jgi:hypothetical protein
MSSGLQASVHQARLGLAQHHDFVRQCPRALEVRHLMVLQTSVTSVQTEFIFDQLWRG